MERVILHIDMDAFFASVEQHDHPEWKGCPVIVGAPPDQRGVVSTCSYEARAFGVHSAMPSCLAYELCPKGIFIRPRIARYHEVSQQVFAIFSDATPLVEGVSVDEAFLDVTGVRRLLGDPVTLAKKIKARIANELGLTASVGIAPNKFLAKLASEERKPDGLFEVPKNIQEQLRWLGSKSVRKLWGVGDTLAAQLEAGGLRTVHDIQCAAPETLTALTTPGLAAHLSAIAFGRDSAPVQPEREEKSYSRELTYPEDTDDYERLRKDLRMLADDVAYRLRAAGVWARTGKLKLRYTGFRTVTRQATFDTPVCDDFALRALAQRLLETHLEKSPIRLIGFGVDNLVSSPTPPVPDDLFARVTPVTHPREREERLFKTLDNLRKHFKGRI
ncbi:MAG: DNA polymerase IV [Kiritimatiellia bacterium]